MPDEKKKWLIFSLGHMEWWSPARTGYTPDQRLAGRYDEQEAIDICRMANLGMQFYPFDLPSECMLLAPECVESGV